MDSFISTCQKLDSSFFHPLLLRLFYLIKSSYAQSPKAGARRPSSIECGEPHSAELHLLILPLKHLQILPHSHALKWTASPPHNALIKSLLPVLPPVLYFAWNTLLSCLTGKFLQLSQNLVQMSSPLYRINLSFIQACDTLPPTSNITVVYMSHLSHKTMSSFYFIVRKTLAPKDEVTQSSSSSLSLSIAEQGLEDILKTGLMPKGSLG